MKNNKVKVVFLIEKPEGDLPCNVFAFFPEMKYNQDPGMFTSYSHIGQHSACHVEYARKCKKAPVKKYSEIKSELESIGYDLDITTLY